MLGLTAPLLATSTRENGGVERHEIRPETCGYKAKQTRMDLDVYNIIHIYVYIYIYIIVLYSYRLHMCVYMHVYVHIYDYIRVISTYVCNYIQYQCIYNDYVILCVCVHTVYIHVNILYDIRIVCYTYIEKYQIIYTAHTEKTLM